MPRSITSSTSLDTLKKDAKRWLQQLRGDDAAARERYQRAYPSGPSEPTLRDVQHALARECGHESWVHLKRALAERPAEVAPDRLRAAEDYERLANDWVSAFDARDEAALQRLNEYYGRTFTFADLSAEIWRRVYAFRQRSSRVERNLLQVSEAQTLLAQDVGFANWTALTRAASTGAPPVPAYAVDATEYVISPRRRLNDREWDTLLAVANHRRITSINGIGLISDSVLARLSKLPHLTTLDLSGCRELSEDGLRHLASMPQLERLNLTGVALTDRGLEVLRHLPNLKAFELTWGRGISDAGVAHLESCHEIQHVNLMGSATGDGAVRALRGKAHLEHLSTGLLVTDEGLRLLHDLPKFRRWSRSRTVTTGDETAGARLLIDGPFTDHGLSSLAGLEGVVDLDLFWHATAITPDGFTHLAGLPNLEAVGADGALCDNLSMRHLASLPRLRRLRAQGTVATDEGFEALSRSQTLESFWGRECPNLASRGFIALSRMPALRSLGVSCKNVDDSALATLPDFPSLWQLTPIDVKDAGFSHIGRCQRLKRLQCMYCRETSDVATAHVAGLALEYYYAGLTQITDRSLEILSGIRSFEQIEFYGTAGITDAGLVFLATLPLLREVSFASLPGVTLDGTRVFPKRVNVTYST